jgi:hypothetical protein
LQPRPTGRFSCNRQVATKTKTNKACNQVATKTKLQPRSRPTGRFSCNRQVATKTNVTFQLQPTPA